MEKEKRGRKFQTKMNVIVDLILDRGKEGKFIIFSSYDESFESLCHLLQDHGIQYTQLQGRNESRSKQIMDFKRGEMMVLFLTSIHDSAGMNLQESTDVILYHPTSEDLETQIIGRAYRVGRNIPLHVHHLV
jgi:SNF2 family DNA or RNA helicase